MSFGYVLWLTMLAHVSHHNQPFLHTKQRQQHTDHDNWFTNLIQQKEYEEAFNKSSDACSRFRAIFDQHAPTLRAVSVWLIAMGIMIAYSMLEVGWSFTEAQYFAISTLSTGGLWRIPDDSSTWMFGVTGVFAMLGVPIMAVAMAQVARGLTEKGDLEATKGTVNEPVTAEELIMLQKFGLESKLLLVYTFEGGCI